MATLKQMKNGLTLKPSYEQVLSSYLSGGPSIPTPNRLASKIRESPQYQDLLKINFIGLQEQAEKTRQNQKRETVIHELFQRAGDVRSVLARSRAVSSMESAISSIDDDLQSLNSLDTDLAYQYEMADEFFNQTEEAKKSKIEQRGKRLIQTHLDEVRKQSEYLGGIGFLDPQTRSAVGTGSASSTDNPQRFDITDEGQPEVASEAQQREFLQKQTIAELKKYAESLNLIVPANMPKKKTPLT